MLLKVSEIVDKGIRSERVRCIYINDDKIVSLSKDIGPPSWTDKTPLYRLILEGSGTIDISGESFSSLVSILGWIDPADLEKTETVVRGSLDLLSQPSTSEPKRKKKIRGSGSE